MIGDKRGLSTIVVTLIIVLLSLIAVGIVWVVVRNLITSGSQGVDINSKCLGVAIEVEQVTCADSGSGTSECVVRLSRTGTETEAIGGVKMVFRNESSGVTSTLLDNAGNIEPLVGLTTVPLDTGVALADEVDTVEVTAYFTDSAGNPQLCPQTTTYTF